MSREGLGNRRVQRFPLPIAIGPFDRSGVKEKLLPGDEAACPIPGISGQGMAGCREMDADLMSRAGMGGRFDQCMRAEALEGPDRGLGWGAAVATRITGGEGTDPRMGLAMLADRQVDPKGRVQIAFDQAVVGLLHPMFGETGTKHRVGILCSRGDQDARGPGVEAMDQAAFAHPPACCTLREVLCQPSSDRRTLSADEGDAGQARWFCQSEIVASLGEEARRREVAGVRSGIRPDRDPVAAAQQKRFGDSPAVDTAATHHASRRTPSEASGPGEENIEAHAVVLLFDDDGELPGLDRPNHPLSLGARALPVEQERP
jgi:hypothetical protein